LQTHPLVREGAPKKQDHNFHIATLRQDGRESQSGLDTRTYCLTDRPSYSNFNFDFDREVADRVPDSWFTVVNINNWFTAVTTIRPVYSLIMAQVSLQKKHVLIVSQVLIKWCNS
jgi:hypothetical protein